MLDKLLTETLAALDPTRIMVQIVAAILGIIYLSYGKRHNAFYALCGLGLLLYPYFVDTTFQLIAIGAGLLLAPIIVGFLIRR